MASLTSQSGSAPRTAELRSRVPARRPTDSSTALKPHGAAGAGAVTAQQRGTEAGTAARMHMPSGPTHGPRSRNPPTSQARAEPRPALRTPTNRLRAPSTSGPDVAHVAPQRRSPPNTLRRKPSIIGAHARSIRQPQPSSSSDHQHGLKLYREPPRPGRQPDACSSASGNGPYALGNGIVKPMGEPAPISSPDHLAQVPRLPTPSFTAVSSSPSTRHSESPGPWSRTSTPTSMSSHSPGLVPPSKWGPRPRTTSPNRRRPPITWKGAFATMDDDDVGWSESQGLPSLRESVVSSSSSSRSTVGLNQRRYPGDAVRKDLRPSPGNERKEQLETSANVQWPRRTAVVPPPRKSSARSAAAAAPKTSASQHVIERQPSAAADCRLTSPASAVPSPFPDSLILLAPGKPYEVSPVRDEPPPRPSRDGAPNLGSVDDVSLIPVIRSNLAGLPFYGQRRRGSNDIVGSSWPAFKDPSKAAPSPEPAGPSTDIIREHGAWPMTRLRAQTFSEGAGSSGSSAAPSPAQLVDGKLRRRGVSPVSQPGSGKGVSRFGLFARRAVTVSEGETAAPAKKAAKKGPAAGTGHEGYGRHVARGRSGSATSTVGSWDRSDSVSTFGSGLGSLHGRRDSLKSNGEHTLDEFFLDRLDPVVIVGGQRNATVEAAPDGRDRSETGHDLLDRRPSVDSQSSGSAEFSAFSQAGGDMPEPVLRPSHERSRPHLAEAAPATTTDGTSATTTSDAPAVHAAEPLPQKRSFRSLPRLNTDPLGLAKPHGRRMTDAASVKPDRLGPRYDEAPEGKEGFWLMSGKTKERAASPGAQLVSRSPPRSPEKGVLDRVRVQVAPHLATRLVPHYAMLDSTDLEDDDEDDLGDIMEFAELSESDDHLDKGQACRWEDVSPMLKDHPASVLLPDPPSLPLGFQSPRPASPKVMLRTAEVSTATLPSPPTDQHLLPSRPARLQQVGRIPRVESSRFRKPPLQSFSRPFSSVRPDMVAPLGGPPNQTTLSTRDQELHPSIPECPQDVPLTTKQAAEGPINRCSNRPSFRSAGHRKPSNSGEFLVFPAQRTSEMSCSNSSGSASLTAIPRLLPPFEVGPGVDEVWKEYDDLIDEVFTPQTGYSLRSSFGFPGQQRSSIEATASNEAASCRASHIRLQSITTGVGNELPGTGAGRPLGLSIVPQGSLAPPELSTPGSPMSYTHIIAGYGNRGSKSSAVASVAIDTSPPKSSTSLTPPSFRADAEGQGSSDKAISPCTEHGQEEQDGLDLEVNVRFGALMTSRWLSFGRVLFSPVHESFSQARQTSRQERLLVLDGLGNDDWSYYCALTYPDAIVYNLSPSTSSTAASSKKQVSDVSPSPTNHRQIHRASFTNPFPFPKGFFAAIVFRFPVASSEATYRNAISECKRVLRPGGYLEVSVLDLDLMNMGNRARRAVRDLKVRMQGADGSLTLKPASDTILRLLGRRGFENVNRCTLGVPAAGSVVSSRETSVDEAGPSLNELLRDRSAESDQGITKMVARVGRWWYSRCYETSTLSDGVPSDTIWRDRSLLRECAARKTSFKLLICYAQKPLAPRRRTVSV